MTASRVDCVAYGRGLAFAALAAGALACTTPSAPPIVSPVEWLASPSAYLPDEADHLARDAAAAALLSDRRVGGKALARLETLDRNRVENDGRPTGLGPFARNLADSTLDDRIAYREATRSLLEQDDLDEGLRARLELEARDDPLELADQRLRDARLLSRARIFNALVAPAGRSVVSGALLPYRMLRALIGIAVAEHLEPELSLPERQALAHWKRFLEEHPDAPEAVHIVEWVEASQLRWYRTRRDEAVRRAKRALDTGSAATAHAFADRALRYAPEDREARRIRDEAFRRVSAKRARGWRSDGAPSVAPPELTAGRSLAVALLTRPEAIEAEASALLELDPKGELADEASFSLAILEREATDEAALWQRVEKLASCDPADCNMSRHARSWLEDPEQHPWAAFGEAKSRERSVRWRWLLLGQLAAGPRDRDLPRLVEWMIEIPAFAEVFAGFGNRLFRYPWIAPRLRSPAVMAARYVERFPAGEHVEEGLAWLQDNAADRGNQVAAHEWAKLQPEAVGPDELAELAEAAAEQALEFSRREPRLDLRIALLERVARDYADTEAGPQAGILARDERRRASPQSIRLTREFLLENPRIVGPEALGLRPELLDREVLNGELHPQGVTLESGRVIAFAFLAESGRETDEPVVRHKTVSKERMARLVAMLEEITLRLALVDRDYVITPDADRDLFFERVRLRVTERPDMRPTAQSTYTFEGMREKYGLVRSRESILPVELVVQGTLGSDVGLGAFPRIRLPKRTPDAILYE